MIPLTLVVSNWFESRRGLALGLAAAGSGLPTILFPPLVTEIITRWGLKTALYGEAVLGVLLTLGVFLLVRSHPSRWGSLPIPAQSQSRPLRRRQTVSPLPDCAPSTGGRQQWPPF